MNPEAQELLNKILQKDPDKLTQDEILFLRARKSYLKESQLTEYQSVLEVKPVEKPNSGNGTVKTKHGKS